jgi:drug/metabolite transporter (DMT)-like permease
MTQVGTAASTRPRQTMRDWRNLAIVTALWGSAYALTHEAVMTVAPTWAAAGRLLAGALMLAVMVRVMRLTLPPLADARTWGLLVLIGTVGSTAPFVLISTAQTEVPSGLAAIFIAGAPILLTLAAHFVLPDGRLTLRTAAGVALGFAGVFLLFLPTLDGQGQGALAAQVKLVAAAACYAALGLMVRLMAPSLPPVVMAFGFTAGAAVTAVLVALVLPSAPVIAGASPSWASLLAILALGLGATGWAGVLQVEVTRSAGPVFLSMVGYLAPFFSVVLGALLFAERLPPTALLALLAILGGVALAQYRPAAR